MRSSWDGSRRNSVWRKVKTNADTLTDSTKGKKTLERIEVDFLVIGSGLAGLTYALNAAPHGSVALLTKKTRTDANSSWAQGGIAGVLAGDDSFELHKQDTLVAGAGLCNEAAVEILVREGPERIRELIQLGAKFNMETNSEGDDVLSLGREGGHSRNRIVHTADYTGWECERTLLEAVKNSRDSPLRPTAVRVGSSLLCQQRD